MNNAFIIHGLTGDLSCIALDREVYPSYSLLVQATDNGVPPRSATCTIEITVLDDNDNDPAFDQSLYTASIYEAIANDTNVLTVHATDADIGANGMVTYYINNTDNGNFVINRDTGVIYSNG